MQEIDRSVFKGVKLVLSTPTMGHTVCEQYADSRAELEKYLLILGVTCIPHRVRDTYLPRARNVLAAAFLETDADWQLSFDSDMGFDVAGVIQMFYQALTNPEIQIIGAPYPQKRIDWARVKEAVQRNPGITEDELNCIAAGSWTFKGTDNGKHDIGKPIELVKIGEQFPHVATGVLLVKRSVYQKMRTDLNIEYTDKHSGKPMWKFFHADVQKGEWVGEDAWFCRKWHGLGGKMFLAPWVKTDHVGQVVFRGDVSKIIDAGMELPA